MFDIFYLIFFGIGLCFGSFGNVIIVRLPQKKSIVFPSSHCIVCQKQISWFDNIPLFSWLLLRGKCRNCQAKISSRYPLVELITAILFATAYHFDGLSWNLLEHLIFIFPLVVCSFIDMEHMILPDEMTLSGVVIGLLGAALNPDRSFLEAIIGVLIGGGFLYLIATIYFLITKNEGMGGGDIKLLAWIGAVLGWQSIPYVILSSAVVGSIVGLLLAWRQNKGLKTVIPYGPYLAVAAVSYIFGCQNLASQYLSLFLPELM